MLGTPIVKDLILKGEIEQIKDIMTKSENLGMQTFDAALYKLYKSGKISLEEALRNADSQNNLRLRISLEETDSDTQDTSLSRLSLQNHDEEPAQDSSIEARMTSQHGR